MLLIKYGYGQVQTTGDLAMQHVVAFSFAVVFFPMPVVSFQCSMYAVCIVVNRTDTERQTSATAAIVTVTVTHHTSHAPPFVFPSKYNMHNFINTHYGKR